MNILVTGAAGFVGRNLVENLKNIRDGKNRTRPNITIDEIFEYDLGNTQDQPQVPNTARQAASLPGDISRGKRSSMPQPKTKPDSPVPSLQGPCDRCTDHVADHALIT